MANGIRACAGVACRCRRCRLTPHMVCGAQFSGLTQEIYSVPLPYSFKGRPFSAVSLDMYEVRYHAAIGPVCPVASTHAH